MKTLVVLSTEFWIVFQVCVILFFSLFFWYFIKNGKPSAGNNDEKNVSAEKILNLIEPLLKEAESSAEIFETQIIEKKQIIKQLNEKLDSRIISLNLLLNRADACLIKNGGMETPVDDVTGTQETILALYNAGYDTEAISKKLEVSGKEVDLVIELKKKFLAMGNNVIQEDRKRGA